MMCFMKTIIYICGLGIIKINQIRTDCTVKPVLTTTSEQRPPVSNGQAKSVQVNFDTNFDWRTSTTATFWGPKGGRFIQV
jgi:hypothetical protein